jgi:SAM-dependent methyltransferase
MAQLTSPAAVGGVPLACPKCHGQLNYVGDALHCSNCGLDYPVVDGRPCFVAPPTTTWAPPVPQTGGWFRRHLAQPPPAARFAGETQNGGVTNDHRYLREFLAGFPDTAAVLDLGSGERRLRPGIVNLDIVASPSVDVIADGHQLPFPDGVFEAVILQSVIEHVLEPERFLAESCRVLKPGGQIWVEAPFLYPIHDTSDYYRWTLSGLRYVVSKHFEVSRSGALMGPSSALNLSWRVYVNWKLRRLHWGFRNTVAWMTAWIKWLDPDQVMPEPPEIYAHTYVLGIKQPTIT